MSENSAAVPAAREPVAGIGDGLAGIASIFFDPAGAARRIPLRWFWIYPFIVSCAVTIFYTLALQPYSLKVAEISMRDRGMSGEQLQNALAMAQKFSIIGPIVTPIFVLLFVALGAWLIGVAASITDVRTRFRNLFSLVMVSGMIPLVQLIATIIVLKSKFPSPDDIQSPQDVQPGFGLDMFVTQPKIVWSFLHFFSIFEIWTLIMLALTFAAMTGTTKGKAFFATSPVWLLGLIFAVLGGLFQR